MAAGPTTSDPPGRQGQAVVRRREHPVQLYFKRARSSEILLGAPAYHRDLLVRHLAL